VLGPEVDHDGRLDEPERDAEEDQASQEAQELAGSGLAHGSWILCRPKKIVSSASPTAPKEIRSAGSRRSAGTSKVSVSVCFVPAVSTAGVGAWGGGRGR